MKNHLIIPKIIHVGYQNRKDTYSGKLAYVIYTDAKGKKRKECSWEGWIDKDIPVDDFENEPMTGFVLNKKTGDYSDRYGGRMAHIRVFDPRGFEVEIKLENLLYVLQETSSIKGKGLEGEFVYSWDRQDLILLPVDSAEYRHSSAYTSLQTKKVTKSDMVEGCMYQTKDNVEVMYLGRHEHYWCARDYGTVGYAPRIYNNKYHIFMYKNKDGDSKYRLESGFTKLAKRLTEVVSDAYPEEYEKYKKEHGELKFVRLVPTKTSWDKIKNDYFFLEKDGQYHRLFIPSTWHKTEAKLKSVNVVELRSDQVLLPRGYASYNPHNHYWNQSKTQKEAYHFLTTTEEHLTPVKLSVELNNGKIIDI